MNVHRFRHYSLIVFHWKKKPQDKIADDKAGLEAELFGPLSPQLHGNNVETDMAPCLSCHGLQSMYVSALQIVAWKHWTQKLQMPFWCFHEELCATFESPTDNEFQMQSKGIHLSYTEPIQGTFM